MTEPIFGHEVLAVCDAIDATSNRSGNTDLKRIVSMLTRLIQRTESVSEGFIESSNKYVPYAKLR